jgi:hypothetical protein
MQPHEATEDAFERPVTRHHLSDSEPFLDSSPRDPLG